MIETIRGESVTMSDLTKFELKKIVEKKRTYILIIGMVLVNLAAFLITDFAYARAFVPEEKTHSVKLLTGPDAIRYERQISAKYSGLLTDEKARAMASDFSALRRSLKGYSEDEAQCVMNSYLNEQILLERLQNPDGSLKPVSSLSPRPIRLGYSEGWKGMVGSFTGVGTLILCVILIVCVSPVFSEEYDWNTDAVLRCTRYGKSKVIRAKILASFLFLSAIYTAFAVLNFCLYGAVYGLDGANCDIQSSAAYAFSGYSLTFLQLGLSSFGMGVAGLFCLTAAVLCISALSKSTAAAGICSSAAVLVPLLFDFSDSYPAVQKNLELLPIYMMHASGVFQKVQTYSGVLQPACMAAVVCCAMPVFLGGVFCASRQHQPV